MRSEVVYQRDDWVMLRSLNTLPQKAGVSLGLVARLSVKELADNALDQAGTCRFGLLPEGDGAYVEDDGGGIEGDDLRVAHLFSIARPMVSTKVRRMPTRGALGNGLRVVAGAVLASRGSLIVRTGGRSLRLAPQDDGTTTPERLGGWDGKGTRVEVRFGPALLGEDPDMLAWVKIADELAGGAHYAGKSSPWWYDEDAFWELLQAAGRRTVREVVAGLEGCGGRTAGEVAGNFLGKESASLSRAQAARLLKHARQFAKKVNPARLGAVGRLGRFTGYGKSPGAFKVAPAHGGLGAEVPYFVEAWANAADEPALTVCVNRTPVTAEMFVWRPPKRRTDYVVKGCGLADHMTVGRKRDFSILVNVQCPAMPIIDDSKEPDLRQFKGSLTESMRRGVGRANKAARSGASGTPATTQKDFIIASLPAAVDKASGGGASRYSQRQLFYAVRELFLAEFRQEPLFNTFKRIVTDYEDAIGHDLEGIYRDTRGVLYHPHSGQEIPLGTRSVEHYRRPEWTFNKILYCEKEGFFPLLKDARWPERNDCALLTSKGFATRAARDVLDLLGATDEELTFFCIHDADGPGTLIYEKLQHAAPARSARSVRIINLGLEPEEALRMGLAPEPVIRKGGKAVPVADYVSPRWRAWLQTRRVELNAMDTPRFLGWLDGKMEEYRGKLIPPSETLGETLEGFVRDGLREEITEEILESADLDGQVEAALRACGPAVGACVETLAQEVGQALDAAPEKSWRAPVQAEADKIVDERGDM